MIRWLRAVWPPWWVIVAVVLIHAAVQALFLSATWALGVPVLFTQEDKRARLALASFFAVLYAVYRIWAFHPALRPDYYRWLSQTPWTSSKRLPLGPVHLVPQDVAALAVLVGLNWPFLHEEALVAIPAFLFTYCLAMGAAHYSTGVRAWAYAVGFGIGLMVLLVVDPVPFAVAAAVTYGLAYGGLRESLARFPWPGTAAAQLAQPPGRVKALGWPYHRLGPRGHDLDTDMIAWRDTLPAGLLAGWGFFVVSWHLRQPTDHDGAYLFCLMFLGIGVLTRLACYCDGYVPPLSLAGRFATGQWIIPGYDQVFVAPLLAVLVAVTAWFIPVVAGVPRIFVTPAAITLAIWILLGMGPSLRAWRLTGNHRIAPGVPTKDVSR